MKDESKVVARVLFQLLARSIVNDETVYMQDTNGTACCVSTSGWMTYTTYSEGKSLRLLPIGDMKYIKVDGVDRKFSYGEFWTP